MQLLLLQPPFQEIGRIYSLFWPHTLHSQIQQFPTTEQSNKTIAITAGNGSKDVIIVRGTGQGMDLERLAASEGPRGTRPWEQCGLFTTRTAEEGTHVRTLHGLPVDFWLTRLICAFHTICWLGLLILVAGIKSNTWYLLIVGAMGMFQNAFIAGVSVNPEGQPISLLCKEIIHGNKVMDALMDLEVKLEEDKGLGRKDCFDIIKPLLNDFFPGDLREDEVKWWKGDRHDYDEKRVQEKVWRGISRSRCGVEKPRSLTQDSTGTEEEIFARSFKYPSSDMDSRITAGPGAFSSIPEAGYQQYEEGDSEDRIYRISPGMA